MAGGGNEVLGSAAAEVVIVGAGIAGLATALALRRSGVARDVLVLERHSELRASGAALTIFPNGWCALGALGVAHKLASRYDTYQTSRVTNLETGTTQVFRFAGNKSRTKLGEVGATAVARQTLLQALAEELPPGTIRFSSKLVSLETERAAGDSSAVTVLRLDDGTVIKAKVLIGCDGVHSVVARWLGLSEPASSGRSAVRGLSVFPGGHGLKRELRQFLSEGLRAGMMPVTDTDVYWYLANYTIPVEKEAARDPVKILREVTENLARHMPTEYLDVVHHSDQRNLSWTPLLYRNPWNLLTGKAAHGAATVAGDAFHPMTSDMGQGGNAALEDAVVLARSLAQAATAAKGIAAYVAERRSRVAWIVAGAYLSGWVQQGGTNNVHSVHGYMVKLFRDLIFYRFLFPKLQDTMLYNCGDLPKYHLRSRM